MGIINKLKTQMQHFCKATAYFGLQSHMCQKKAHLATPEVQGAFMNHINEMGLSYGTQEEFDFRLSIFAQKDAENKEINSDKDNTFTVGHNQFSTWTQEEYRKLLGFRGKNTDNLEKNIEILSEVNLPTEVNWND